MKLQRLALAAALLGATAGAQAAVLEWGFVNNSTFSNAIFETGGNGTTTANPAGNELSWGSGSGNFQSPSGNRSALTIGTGETGTARVGGGPATAADGVFTNFGGPIQTNQIGMGITMTHWNNPIDSNFNTLLRATLTDSLTLTPVDPEGDPFDVLPALVFNFEFRETSNNPPGACAGGTPEPCGDLFGFQGTPNLNIPFEYLGDDYFASILILGPNFSTSPIAFLNDGQCAALGFTTGTTGQRCQGFLTSENAATTVRFGFLISTERIPIPEPGSLALIGLGLAGLGFSIKRQRKA